MNRLLELVFPSVDSVLRLFHKAIERLEAVEQRHQRNKEALASKLAELSSAHAKIEAERVRAASIAAKMRAMFS